MKKLVEFSPSERPLVCCLLHCLGVIMRDVKMQMMLGVPYEELTLGHPTYERLTNALGVQLRETMQSTTDEVIDLAFEVGEAGEIAEFLTRLFGKDVAHQMMKDMIAGKVPPTPPSPDGPPAPGLDDVPPLFRGALD